MPRFPKPPEGSWTEHYPQLGTAPVSYADSISPEYYERERKAIFQRAWLNVGRVEQLPRAGSYFTKDVRAAHASILVVRAAGGTVRAFHNPLREFRQETGPLTGITLATACHRGRSCR